MAQAKSGRKNRKYGRNTAKCLVYKNENRRLRNKIKKLKSYIRRAPNDMQAQRALARLTA